MIYKHRNEVSHVHSNEDPFFTLEVKDCLETLSTSDINETTLMVYLINVHTSSIYQSVYVKVFLL